MTPGPEEWQGNPQEFKFDVRNPEQFNKISSGKVVLFFNATFKSEQTGYSLLHNLCFVDELFNFTWSDSGVIIT